MSREKIKIKGRYLMLIPLLIYGAFCIWPYFWNQSCTEHTWWMWCYPSCEGLNNLAKPLIAIIRTIVLIVLGVTGVFFIGGCLIFIAEFLDEYLTIKL